MTILEVLTRHRIPIMPWSSCSPDINTIDYIWDVVGKAVMERRPLNVRQLEQFVLQEWGRVSQRTCMDYVLSLQNRWPKPTKVTRDIKVFIRDRYYNNVMSFFLKSFLYARWYLNVKILLKIKQWSILWLLIFTNSYITSSNIKTDQLNNPIFYDL